MFVNVFVFSSQVKDINKPLKTHTHTHKKKKKSITPNTKTVLKTKNNLKHITNIHIGMFLSEPIGRPPARECFPFV
jgi:hypothetical protein